MNTDSKIPRILVTSSSKKVPLIKLLKIALEKISSDSAIIGADIDQDCISSYFVDYFWLMPKIENLTDEFLLSKLKEFKITGIIPTRDGELSYFASKKDLLKKHRIALMLPDLMTVETCLDKLKLSTALAEQHFPVIPSAISLEQIDSKCFVVKEQFGAGSKTILVNADDETTLAFAQQLTSPIFQPFVEGEEFSIDVYFDQSSNCKGVVARRRLKVVNGESQITETQREPKLEALCQSIGEKLNLNGHAVFQALKTTDNSFQIIEINSRFGGASTLSVAAGLDSFYWFALESIGVDISELEMQRAKTNLRQVRYAQDKIIEA